jgi:hypothetical protein
MNNIKSKIRKNGITLMALSLGALSTGCLTSCGDFLEIEPQNEIVLEKFWNEKGDVEAVIAGCYAKLQSEEIISRMMVWGEFRSENVVYTDPDHKDHNLERVLKENLTANNGYTKWGDFYTIINRCNTILKYAPGVAAKDPSYTQSQLNADIAEVTAIRSLCYFYLIRTFRDVPYTEQCYEDDSEDGDNKQQLALPAESFETVLSKLISSLEAVKDYALEGYPSTSNAYSTYFTTGRVTKWAIYAMLCEMYLWQKDYDNCIKYANYIIEHKKEEIKKQKAYTAEDFAKWDGYPLIGTKYTTSTSYYGQGFNEIFVEGNSIESIFELTFIKDNDNLASNAPYSNFYGGRERTPWVNVSSFVSLDEWNATYKVFDKQNKGLDMRAYEFIAWEGKDEPDHVNKNTAYTTTELLSPTASNFWSGSEWSSQYPTFGMNHDSRNKANVIYYRLSDIMLLAAEAYSQLIKQESGDVTSDEDVQNLYNAFKLVNAVNKRSVGEQVLKDTLVLKNYKTKEAITDLVYEERHRELMFEGKRYYDLVRRSQRDGNTEYMASKCSNKDTNLQSIIQSKLKKMDAIYWPYNLDEMKVNPHLIQNSAFGSGENSSIEAN